MIQSLGSLLQRDSLQGIRSSGGYIEPSIRLAVTIRMLAGVSYLDVMLAFRIAKSTVYSVMQETTEAICERWALPGIPFERKGALRRLSIGFTQSRCPPSPLHGCVGALDGVLVKISKPPNSCRPAQFYCRKGFYAIPVQVVCDYRYKILHASMKCAGSTHDRIAFAVSELYARLSSGDLPNVFWIAGDEAYEYNNNVLAPWPSSNLDDAKDAFNFYQSSLRMHIEQCFGQVVARFGILWRPLKVDTFSFSKIVLSIFLIHNFLKDENENAVPSSPQEDRRTRDAFKAWWRISGTETGDTQGRRRDLEKSSMRDELTNLLRSRGDKRPEI
jgi:DDE superfamily endonuclease